jgi:hypothetical protein
MKRDLFLAVLLFSMAKLCFADPISVVVPNIHTKAGALRTIQINAKEIRYADAYQRLSELLLAAPEKQKAPVVVRMDENCRFSDWYSVRGLMDKIGFMEVRYFVYSKETNYMCEIEPRPAVPVSSNPPKLNPELDSTESKDWR